MNSSVGVAVGGDFAKLEVWTTAMAADAAGYGGGGTRDETINENDVEMISTTLEQCIDTDVERFTAICPMREPLSPIDADKLLKDQRRAYDIVSWHLQEVLKKNDPPQLLMLIPGEGGVGKSKTIQTITANFVSLNAGDMLVKAAYTGIAASTIGGKTLHTVAGIPLNGGQPSAKTIKRLAAYWASKRYLIIDEMSMVSKELLAKISTIIVRAKGQTEQPFGGLNIILVGDFHQFPPVICHKSAPLYCPSNPQYDSNDALTGRKLFEEFKIVVRLKEQVRVTDPVWNDLLQHVRFGSCKEHHLKLLRSLIISHPDCPPTDYTTKPWNDAILITPRHSVRNHWNTASVSGR